MENDANACALAEWRWGAGQGCRSMAFLTFGTGLGAGLILDGRLYRGACGMAGELGHWRLSDYGPTGYGKEGSFEGFCSGGGIRQLAETLALRERQKGAPFPWVPVRSQPALWQRPPGGATAGAGGAGPCGAPAGARTGPAGGPAEPGAHRDRLYLCPLRRTAARRHAAHIAQEALPASLAACRILPAALGDRIGDYAALAIAMAGVEQA